MDEGMPAVLELLNAAAAELESMGKAEAAAELRDIIASLSAGGEDEEAEIEQEEEARAAAED